MPATLIMHCHSQEGATCLQRTQPAVSSNPARRPPRDTRHCSRFVHSHRRSFWPHQRVYGRVIIAGRAGGEGNGDERTNLSSSYRITKFGRYIAQPLQLICAKFHDQIRIGRPSKSRSHETTPIRNGIFALMRPPQLTAGLLVLVQFNVLICTLLCCC